jgi:hypothetical protein
MLSKDEVELGFLDLLPQTLQVTLQNSPFQGTSTSIFCEHLFPESELAF